MDINTNFGAKKRRQTIPRNICSAPRKLTHLRQRCARKNRPRQVVNEFGLVGCESPTVRIPSLISVLMENYLSMICIISLDKKSYKFHSNAIYKPSNLNERVYSIGKEIIKLFFKGTWNQVQFLNSSRLCKIFKKIIFEIFFECFHNNFMKS